MDKETLFNLYVTIAENGKSTPQELSRLSGLSLSYTYKLAKFLKHAGLVREHYIKKRTRYSTVPAVFAVLDASHEPETVAFIFSEALRIIKQDDIYVCEYFPFNERLPLFISRTIGDHPEENGITSYCLLPPEGLDKYDIAMLRKIIPIVHTDVLSAAFRMRRKYFDVMLQIFEKRSCQKRASVI